MGKIRNKSADVTQKGIIECNPRSPYSNYLRSYPLNCAAIPSHVNGFLWKKTNSVLRVPTP